MIKWVIRLFRRYKKKKKWNNWVGTIPTPPSRDRTAHTPSPSAYESKSSDAGLRSEDNYSPGFGLLGVIDALDQPGPSWDTASSGSTDIGGSSFDGFGGGDGGGGGASGDW